MLIDEADIVIKGGHGGRGIVSFGKKEHSGPDGGNGGSGGDLWVRAASDITLLNQFKMKTIFAGKNGQSGAKNLRSGKNGIDMEILLPVGASIVDNSNGQTLLELTKVGEKVLLCKGGKGGLGNWEFRNSRNTTPKYSQSGLAGEEKNVKVVLKLIADYGFIGFPNAGKSSLLNELTNTKAKIAAYAFTTLSPNLGVLNGKIFADIPGLIEGASEGKGLGTSFLKHIEKVHSLLHCVSSETKDPIKDYETVRSELGRYNAVLLEKPELILITKSDLVGKKRMNSLIKLLRSRSMQVLGVSIYDWESIEALKQILQENGIYHA